MPSGEIDKLFHEHKLHSGGSGKVVTNPAQATAIKLSYLRKEGKLRTPAPSSVKRNKEQPR